MPLQGDQRALLQLLCERGQSYEDIAGLLGGTPDDARERARAALTELGGSDPDAEVGLTDYLLGQADPIGRADAVRHLQSDPTALDLAGRIEASLRLLAPDANLPKLPEARGKRRRAAVAGAGDGSESPARTGDPGRIESMSGRGRDGTGLGGRQTTIYAALAGAAVILLVVILAIAGVFGGDDSSGESAPAVAESTDSTDSTDPTTPATPEATFGQVKLAATGNSGVAGTAKFGIANGDQPFVDLAVDGLDPATGREATHLLWLMIGETGGFPIPTPLAPDKNGRFSGRIAIPTPAIAIAQEADTVRVSLSPLKELGRVVTTAAEQGATVVPFTGDQLAAGRIPAARPAEG